MSQKTTELQEKIRRLKKQKKPSVSSAQGYNISLAMLTDLITYILVGLGMGLFFQKVFHTSSLLTAGLTLLGGIAGLYSTIRFAISQDKK